MKKMTLRLDDNTAERVKRFLDANSVTFQGFVEQRMVLLAGLVVRYGPNTDLWPEDDPKAAPFIRTVRETRLRDAERRQRG